MPLGRKHLRRSRSRVAGPNPPHFAPRKNYFLLDTYTKRYTRIAPWLTLSACAGRGLLRAQHFSALPRSRIAPRSTLGFQRLTRIAPCPALPALMLNPDCSVFSTCRSVPCTDCSALVPSRSAPATNYFVFDTWPFRPAPGCLRALDVLPCAVYRSLGVQHLALAPVTNYFVLDAWPSVQRPDASVLSTSRPALPADCSALTALRCASYGLLHAWHLALAPVKDYSSLDT